MRVRSQKRLALPVPRSAMTKKECSQIVRLEYLHREAATALAKVRSGRSSVRRRAAEKYLSLCFGSHHLACVVKDALRMIANEAP